MKVKYYDLENKRVFITGGGSGIGASIVEHFCEQGSCDRGIFIKLKCFTFLKISEKENLLSIHNISEIFGTFLVRFLVGLSEEEYMIDLLHHHNH